MKKQAKILALIMSVCLIFGVIVATVAFADDVPTETNQLDKSYLEGVTLHTDGFAYMALDPENDSYVSDYFRQWSSGISSGTYPYTRGVNAKNFDSIAPDRTNKFAEVRSYFANQSTLYISNKSYTSDNVDYVIWDFDMTATQYLIYFKNPYFIDRDEDGEAVEELIYTDGEAYLGYVAEGAGPYNELFTHALGTFEYDENGNITAINVDSFFFMEPAKYEEKKINEGTPDEYTISVAVDGCNYFPRYLDSDFITDTTLNSANRTGPGGVTVKPYTTQITDPDIIASLNDKNVNNDKNVRNDINDNNDNNATNTKTSKPQKNNTKLII